MKKLMILLMAMCSLSIFAIGSNVEAPVVVKEEFSRKSWAH